MGILNRKLFAGLIGSALIVVRCSTDTPTALSSADCAFTITASVTAVRPDELDISLVDKMGKERKQVVNPVPDNGSVFFPGVPYGPVIVDIVGRQQGTRTLYGHNAFDVGTPQSLVSVNMRGSATAKNIDPAQEQMFLQNGSGRSVFWGTLTKEQNVNCSSPDGRASLLAGIRASSGFLYFLFEVIDSTLLTDVRPTTGFGEFSSDAVIVYVGKIAPHQLSPEKKPFPAVRFQCEVGKSVPESGSYNFNDFTNGTARNGAIRDLVSQDITARVLSLGLGSRLLEVRIKKALLGIAEGTASQPLQYGLVIRYRNNFNLLQPAQQIDWQSGTMENDPRNAEASWGYLELYQ